MSFRVTPQTLSRGVLEGLQANLTRLQRTQEQLSSGRRLNRPSDSPVDTVNAMRVRAEKQQTQQYTRNIDDGLARLGNADSALTQAGSMIDRVRELTLSGINGAVGVDERSALADEVDQLRQGLIQLGNTQYGGKPLFAGTMDGTTVAFDQDGVYVGNDGLVNRNVSADPGSGTVSVNAVGSDAFTTLLSSGRDAAGNPVAGILERISTALRNPDTAAGSVALSSEMGNLDTATGAMISVRGTIGARTNRLDDIQKLSQSRLDSLTTSLANAESIDLPKTIIDMQIQQNAYQAALGATAKIIQPSLMDFLR